MPVYVPLEDVDPRIDNSEPVTEQVDRFHLQLSDSVLAFTKANQQKTLVLTNIGWDKLAFAGLITVNSVFVIENSLPAILLPKVNYFINVTYNSSNVGQSNGGLYVDVGDSYGRKFVALSANL